MKEICKEGIDKTGLNTITIDVHECNELISALEEAKEIFQDQIGVKGSITVSADPIRNWLAKYFQDKGEDNHEAQEKEPVF